MHGQKTNGESFLAYEKFSRACQRGRNKKIYKYDKIYSQDKNVAAFSPEIIPT